MTPCGPDILAYHADALHTRVGAAFPGSRAVFRGHDLHRDLKDMDWLALCAFGIFGRHVPADQLKLFSSVWVWTSYPDARLWNNRIAALAGSTRSTPSLAISAGQAITEATIFGRGNEFRAHDFFLKTRKALAETGIPLAEYMTRFLTEGGRLAGYGRPISSVDERMPLTLDMARRLGLADGPHLALAFEIDAYMVATQRPLRMNLSALLSAFAADFGWSPREFNLLMYTCFLAGMYPCYLEAADQPPQALFAVRCEDVVYEGTAPRAWPK
ncbi:MAG: citrate/2-methylcitrate synthase [Aquabacterium sp.]